MGHNDTRMLIQEYHRANRWIYQGILDRYAYINTRVAKAVDWKLVSRKQ